MKNCDELDFDWSESLFVCKNSDSVVFSLFKLKIPNLMQPWLFLYWFITIFDWVKLVAEFQLSSNGDIFKAIGDRKFSRLLKGLNFSFRFIWLIEDWTSNNWASIIKITENVKYGEIMVNFIFIWIRVSPRW